RVSKIFLIAFSVHLSPFRRRRCPETGVNPVNTPNSESPSAHERRRLFILWKKELRQRQQARGSGHEKDRSSGQTPAPPGGAVLSRNEEGADCGAADCGAEG